MFLNKVKGEKSISAKKSRMAILAMHLTSLKKRKEEIEKVEGFPQVAENTDVAAFFGFEKLREYQKQLKDGFVWLPSRLEIHRRITEALQNHRWPSLIGEAGSGKSKQADAAALELTGYLPTEIECEVTTGEKAMIVDKDIDSENGGSFDAYGPLMQAFTGYKDSRQNEPSIKTGRIVRFDESGRLGPKAFSIIKKARQKKAGDMFYGHPVLHGAAAIWTSNPVGPRYPNRYALDTAMRRELAEIHVPYPDMSVEKPELYEFALAALLDSNGHISVAKQELAPAYEKKDIPEADRKQLANGSMVIGTDELITDMSDPRHGALYRFTAAISALQDSFVYGNSQTSKYPDTLLRYKDVDDGMEVITDGSGGPLTLSNSTVTLGELGSWMSGFNERLQKQDKNFRVKTLTEWLNFKIATYIKQADDADKEKLTAIFKHFHFLDGAVPDLTDAKPMTPKDIGYLSPRVPRPSYVERPVKKEKLVEVVQEAQRKEVVEYATEQVLLEKGARVLIRKEPFMLGTGDATQTVKIGKEIRVAEGDFVFSGIIDDENNEDHKKAVGKPADGEELYRVFETDELERGIFSHEFETMMEEIDVRVPKFLRYYWQASCEDNEINNPDKIALAI